MEQGVAHSVMVVIGTRPEAIKMIPVYLALKKAGITTLLCSTAQHTHLLQQVFDLFGIQPDVTLAVMRPGQDLAYVTNAVIAKTTEIFAQYKPSLVMVQGDTTTAMAAGLAAFYQKIPVAHVEAGLRTYDTSSPFPEELNRRFLGVLASYHFSPTVQATAHLLAESVARESVFYTGNTVVDALRLVREHINSGQLVVESWIKAVVESAAQQGQWLMLLTVHRRESFDGGIERVLRTVKHFLQKHPMVRCVYPYHPNPAVIEAMERVRLTDLPNMQVCQPLEYKDLVYLLMHADQVVTDSGGIQEEAISLGKSVIVLRDKTERMEGVWAGYAQLVGTHEYNIEQALEQSLYRNATDTHRERLYGDGYAAQKIVTILSQQMPALLRRLAAHEKKEAGSMKKICMVGLGYIGLPTALVLADAHFEIYGFDVDTERVTRLLHGDPVIQEPGSDERLQRALQAGTFTAGTQIQPADYFMVAVPTPFTDGKKADLRYVMHAAADIASVLRPGNVVIIESTIPVGTTMEVARYLQECTGLKAGIDFFVAHCPERVLPGNIFKELVENARIIGGINRESVEAAKAVYKEFVTGNVYLTDAATAEMVKLVENSSRDAQIAFAHQVASMAYSVGLDPYEVIELANKHPRVNILTPSCGVGGHCIAVDPWFLVETFPQHTHLLKAAREVNDAKPYEAMARIVAAAQAWMQTHGRRCRVLLLGATYKPNVDDLRESPALHIMQSLIDHEAMECLVVEPHVPQQQLATILQRECVTDLNAGVAWADIVVYLVAHAQFKKVPQQLLCGKTQIDCCGILHEPKTVSAHKEYQFWPAQSAIMDQLEQKHEQRTMSTNKECA